MGDFQESIFQFGVVKSLQGKLIKNDLSKDDDSLVNTRHIQLNQHAGRTFQWSWSLSYAYMLTAGSCSLTTEIGHKSDRELFFDCFARIQYRRFQQRVFSPYSADIVKIHVELLHYNIPCDAH